MPDDFNNNNSLIYTSLLFRLCCRIVRNETSCTTVQSLEMQRDGPWQCPQSEVRGNNSSISMRLWHTQQKRARLRATIPATFPLFPPSFLQILQPLLQFSCPQLSPLLVRLPQSLLAFVFGSRRSKSQGCSSQEQCCHGVAVKKKKGKKVGALSREDLASAALYLS